MEAQTKKQYKWSPYDLTNWDNLSDDAARYIVAQSEKRLITTIETHDLITSRAYTLLSVYVTLLGILITFFGSRLASGYTESDLPLVIIAMIALIPMVGCLIYLVGLIYPEKVMLVGSKPDNLMVESYLQKDKDKQLNTWLYSEIEQMQHKIEYNDASVDVRHQILERVILVSVGTFVLTLAGILGVYFYL